MTKMVDIEATGYVPRQRSGETAEHAAHRVHSRLLAATRYLLSSNRHGVGEERTLFSGEPTEVSLSRARRMIAAHYGREAAFHRLVLSPHPSLGLESPQLMQVWTRRLLSHTCVRAQRPFVWVGAVHGDTHLRHTHLILAGADTVARPVRVRMPFVQAMETGGAQIAAEMMAAQEARWARLGGQR